MNFFQARDLSEKGWHVRRESWPAGKWAFFISGVWWCFTSEHPIARTFPASEYGPEDLDATDWTNIPPQLASCTVNPATGSTGGTPPGGAPPGGGGGWSSSPSHPPFGNPGVSGGGSGGDPGPEPNTIMFILSGMSWRGREFELGNQRLNGSPNRTYYVRKTGEHTWGSYHSFGNFTDYGEGSYEAVAYISVSRNEAGPEALYLMNWSNDFWAGGFDMLGFPSVRRTIPSANYVVDPGVEGVFWGGEGRVM